jgi:hypothetical protein
MEQNLVVSYALSLSNELRFLLYRGINECVLEEMLYLEVSYTSTR